MQLSIILLAYSVSNCLISYIYDLVSYFKWGDNCESVLLEGQYVFGSLLTPVWFRATYFVCLCTVGSSGGYCIRRLSADEALYIKCNHKINGAAKSLAHHKPSIYSYVYIIWPSLGRCQQIYISASSASRTYRKSFLAASDDAHAVKCLYVFGLMCVCLHQCVRVQIVIIMQLHRSGCGSPPTPFWNVCSCCHSIAPPNRVESSNGSALRGC